MRLGEDLQLDVAEAQRVPLRRQAPAPLLADVGAAVHAALETPIGFPPLRRALTPDDHLAIVVDETLHDIPGLLVPLLQYLVGAHVAPGAITLLCQAAAAHPWREQLPAEFRDVHLVEHDPGNRKKLSYLATTRQGRRIYIDREAVDADQVIVVSRRFYDPLLGHGGAEGALFPALSDRDTQQGVLDRLSPAAPGQSSWPLQREAAEVTWLLGAPFFLQVIEGPGGAPVRVLGGLIDTGAEGERLLDAQWRVEAGQAADVVVAEVGGAPETQTFADLAAALLSASRVVKPDGTIIVLSGAAPELGPGAQLLRQVDTPDEALALLRKQKPPDAPAAFAWASAARRAKVFLLSRLPTEIAEELFTVPLENADLAQRLLGSGKVLYLPDAEHTLAVLAPEA
jgi:nickel-dependent lactate racemase